MVKFIEIKAKFASRCPLCKGELVVGETVLWKKGNKARHAVDCLKDELDAYERAGVVAGEYDEPNEFPSEFTWDEGHSVGHGPGCYGECDGEYDCTAPPKSVGRVRR